MLDSLLLLVALSRSGLLLEEYVLIKLALLACPKFCANWSEKLIILLADFGTVSFFE